MAAKLAGHLDLPADVSLEHPAGKLDVRLERREGFADPVAYVVRTARALFEGSVLVKRRALEAQAR